MIIRVFYDPGPNYQQREHSTDVTLPDGLSDSEAVRLGQRSIGGNVMLRVLVYRCPTGNPDAGFSWRRIEEV